MSHGWRVRMHHRFRYFAPDRWYQGIVSGLVSEKSKWIDVGGGKTVFPNDQKLACELAKRCSLLVSVDPSDNIEQNEIAHERAQTTVEEFASDETYDLATLRMVAEHVEQPVLLVQSLARLIKPGGHVVIYTPNRWSPAAIAASLVPNRWHHHFTGLLWGVKEEDVFPTRYRMNTRDQLRTLFQEGGFKEVAFFKLDNVAVMQRFRLTCFLELCLWKALSTLRLRYPENSLLGVYEKM